MGCAINVAIAPHLRLGDITDGKNGSCTAPRFTALHGKVKDSHYGFLFDTNRLKIQNEG
jgi:hypothetical protein